jgi:hypothetical protein
MVEKFFFKIFSFIQFHLGSGIGAAICAITVNVARQALRKGAIQKSSFYQQHQKIS